MWRIAGALILFAGGCAHQAEESAGQSALDHAYQQVTSGTRDDARGDGYLVERTGGSVRVVKETPTGGLGSDVSDAAITSQVQGKLAGQNVQVATRAGLVTLSGKVDSEGAATNAIRDALSLDGVTGVDSQLRWRGEMRAKASGEPTRF
jgi:osmotically-inducible protein OsmY